MNNNNNHIDNLQTSLRDRFENFEIDIDIDINKVIQASSNVKYSKSYFNQYKYWIGTSSIITGLTVLYFVFNNNTENTNSQLNIDFKRNNTEQKVNVINKEKEQLKLTIEPENVNNIETKVQKSISISPNKIQTVKQQPQINHVEKVNENQINIVETQSQTQIEAQVQTESKSSFSDFIKKKSQECKDSIQLFKKKN